MKIIEILSHTLFSIESKNVDMSWSNYLNIFSIAYLNILYCVEFFIWREPLAMTWHVFSRTRIYVSCITKCLYCKLYFTNMAPINASPFLPVYSSVSVFLDPMFWFVAITHVWSNVAFFEIFLTLMLISSKGNVLCPFFGFCPCFLNDELWNKICQSSFVGLS